MLHVWEQAQECEERGAWKEALSFYQQLLGKEPNNPELVHRKIRCLFQVGEGSLALLEEAAASYPNFLLFHRDCVAVLLHEEKLQHALERAKSNLLNFKDNFNVWIDLGAVYNRMGQYKRAETAYQTALAMEPSAEDAWFNWANMYLDRKQYAEAEECYLRVTRINKENEEAWLKLSYCCLFSQDYYVALRYIEEGIKRERNEKGFYYVKSLVLDKLQDIDGALTCIDKALKRGNDYELWKQLIALLKKKGEDTTEAEQFAKEAAQM